MVQEEVDKEFRKRALVPHKCQVVCWAINIDGDIIIVDPPRVGLDSHSVDILNNSGVDKIIYVSCDTMTLVRDLSKMDNYILKDITLVDMFPQTHHIESVVCLEIK